MQGTEVWQLCSHIQHLSLLDPVSPIAEADRAPAALLAAPPTRLLTDVEEMQNVFWSGTAYGQAMLRQLEHAPSQPTKQSARAVQTAPYGNRWGAVTVRGSRGWPGARHQVDRLEHQAARLP